MNFRWRGRVSVLPRNQEEMRVMVMAVLPGSFASLTNGQSNFLEPVLKRLGWAKAVLLYCAENLLSAITVCFRIDSKTSLVKADNGMFTDGAVAEKAWKPEKKIGFFSDFECLCRGPVRARLSSYIESVFFMRRAVYSFLDVRFASETVRPRGVILKPAPGSLMYVGSDYAWSDPSNQIN